MPAPRTSPSGAFVLTLVEETEERDGRTWPYRRVQVCDRDGTQLYLSPDRFAAWFPLDAAWDEQDRAWVASSDSGTMVFSDGPDGWSRAVWDPRSPASTIWHAGSGEQVPVIGSPPPAALREIAR